MPTPKNVQTLQQQKVLPQGSLFFHLIFPASAGAAQRWIFRDPFRGKGETLGFEREGGIFMRRQRRRGGDLGGIHSSSGIDGVEQGEK